MIPNDQQSRPATADQSSGPRTVAIMQPYFIPYAGYFRLFAASDLFVIYDCVQFPRRGWVHRNKLIAASGEPRWLTLPLVKAPQDTLIKDLAFPLDAAALMGERVKPFPGLERPPVATEPIVEALLQANGTPLIYIERLLRAINEYVGLRWNVVRSSSLEVPPELHGQDRILEIIRRVGARRYVNAPGGRELYSQQAFAEAGVELSFLPDYIGPRGSILARILTEERTRLRDEISNST